MLHTEIKFADHLTDVCCNETKHLAEAKDATLSQWNLALIQKPPVAQLSKIFSKLHEARSFTTVFTKPASAR
jgi:hypothetical protein